MNPGLIDYVFLTWCSICNGIFLVWPNSLIQPFVSKVSTNLVNYLWPLDPKNETIYGNFQNLMEGVYSYIAFTTVILGLEIFAINLIVLKIKKYLNGYFSSKHRILNRFKFEKHLGKYVGISLIALILGQFAYLKYAKKPAAINSADKQTQEQYLRMYVLINSGDKKGVNMHPEEAKRYYQDAYDGLIQIQNEKPDWEPTIIKFRLRYLREKLGIPESPTNPQ